MIFMPQAERREVELKIGESEYSEILVTDSENHLLASLIERGLTA